MNIDVKTIATNQENAVNANAIAKMNDQRYHFNKSDLGNLFEPEITSQPIVEKIQNINRTELKEEMAPTIRAINRECGQGDRPVIVEAGTTKYLEAYGTIKTLRTNIQQDSIFLYHCSKSWKNKNWKQKCRLQITYSLLIDNESPKIIEKCMQENVCFESHLNPFTVMSHKIYKKNELPSLEEAIQTSNTLIQDKNYFNGYLKPLNFLEDREKFLKSFETEMEKKFNIQTCARYVKNKLILDYPNKKPLLNVMYQIHMIIYTKSTIESITQERGDAE